jgi:hypothetical protein
MEEALQHRIYQDALAGKGMAQREVMKWIVKREAWLIKHAPKASSPTITRHISPDPDMRTPLSCCSGLRRPIRSAPILDITGRNSCFSLGWFRPLYAADGAANA